MEDSVAPQGPVVLAPYDATWPAKFAQESASIAGVLGPLLVELHHIGSTAIPGIAAKPVIDILAVVTRVDALVALRSGFEKLGYEALGEFGIAGRRYFRKTSAAGVRTHQVHAFADGSPDVRRHLAFRDYLRAHQDDAQAYEALKRRLAPASDGSAGSYSAGKTDFIREIERRAAIWR